MKKQTRLSLLFVTAFGVFPASAPAQSEDVKKRLEELRKVREERRKEARERQAQGGAPGQAGAAAAKAGAPAQAGAATQAQGGAAGKAQGGAAGKAQGGAAGKGGDAGSGAVAGGAPSPIDALRATRADRRKATLERLRERWGTLLGDVRAREELRVHAERMAELQRIRALAEEKKKLKVIEQVDTVLTKEELRHSNAMNALRTGAAPAKP